MLSTKKIWLAIYTRPRWEKKVAALLEKAGYEFYCPIIKVHKQWSDRKKIILEPVFKSYVFVKVEDDLKWNVMHIPGVLNYVHWLGKPAVIKDAEINAIRLFLNELQSDAVSDQLSPDKKVRVKQGIFMDNEGILIRITGKHAVVKINRLGIELLATFDKTNLLVIED